MPERLDRQALRKARADNPGTVEAKLRAIADGSRHEFPTADIDDMLEEIEPAPSSGIDQQFRGLEDAK